ncbi:nucleotidyltransferase family protein [Selenomonadales bacterium OttesenSCG-928-I06]|nr:nucleotidyltransferase family protein [Selenomonadales bacterium OttesenSCG-928-I06]
MKIINYFYHHSNLVTKEKLLLTLALTNSTISQQELNKLLADFEIEDEQLEVILLFAFLQKKQPHLIFPQEITAQLQGVIRYFQYKNTGLLAAFRKIGSELNKEKIGVLLMKGVVMKFLRPEEQRHMYDIDFAVLPKDYDKAVEIARALDFKVSYIAEHSTDFFWNDHGIDIHRFLTKLGRDTSATDQFVWDRAQKVSAFGVDAFLPVTEDIIFMILINAYGNIVAQESSPNRFFWIIDTAFLIREYPNLDWNIVLDNAQKTDQLYKIKIMLSVFDKIIPLQIPENLISSISIIEKAERKHKNEIFTYSLKEIKKKRNEIWESPKRNFTDVINAFKARIVYRSLKMVKVFSLLNFLFLDSALNWVLSTQAQESK